MNWSNIVKCIIPLLCSYLSLLRTVTRTKALKGVVWGDQINLQNLHIISRLSFSIFRELQELQLLRGFQDGLLLTLQWLSLLLKSTKFLECKTCIFGCILFSVWNSMWHNKWSCLKGSGTLELKQVGHESHKCSENLSEDSEDSSLTLSCNIGPGKCGWDQALWAWCAHSASRRLINTEEQNRPGLKHWQKQSNKCLVESICPDVFFFKESTLAPSEESLWATTSCANAGTPNGLGKHNCNQLQLQVARGVGRENRPCNRIFGPSSVGSDRGKFS